LSIIFTGCGCAVEPKPQNDFVFKLYQTATENKLNENAAVSPYCAELLLDFVRTGAAGETKTEIDKVLGKTESGKWTASSSDSPLTVAAALWTQQGQSILPGFQNTAREVFSASVEQTDFSNNAAEAVKRINAWCAEKTKAKIPVLFEKLDATTRCVLAGAIHFAADWKVPFDEKATIEGSFTLQDGTKIKTKIMGQSGRMKYGETDETLILELPYKNEGCVMLLLLPKNAADFAKWESSMTSEKLNALRGTMTPEQVDMRMPRFTVESDLALNEPLKRLGMPTAFSRDANFSKISGQTDLYLSEVRQKTFVKVDETGTEAATVTSAVISIKAALSDSKLFYADRPFLYAIVKESAILFLGRFVKPDGEKMETEKPEPERPFIDPGLSGAGGAFS
jgi:serpin B